MLSIFKNPENNNCIFLHNVLTKILKNNLTKNNVKKFVLATCLSLMSTVYGGNLCHSTDKSASFNNKNFIDFWTAKLTALNDGVPELSPKELEWLDSELKVGGSDIKNSQRLLNAMRSNERKLKDLKAWTSSMATLMKGWKDTPENWIILSHYFLRYETSYHLVDLARAGIINKNIIPWEWQVYEFDGDFINQRRMYYADAIVKCNLPNSLKIDLLKR